MPESVSGLLILAYILVPGFTYAATRNRLSPAPRRSAFEESTSVAISGVLLSTIAVGLVSLLSTTWPDPFVDAKLWFKNGEGYAGEHLAEIVTTSLLVTALSTIFVIGAARLSEGQKLEGVTALLLGSEVANSHSHLYVAVAKSQVVGEYLEVALRDEEGTVYVGLLAGLDTSSDDVPFPVIELYNAGVIPPGETTSIKLHDRRLLVPLSRVTEITTERKVRQVDGKPKS